MIQEKNIVVNRLNYYYLIRNKALPYLKLGNYVFEDPKTGLRIEDIESSHLYLPNYKKVCYDSSELEVSLSLF